jgi:hypothetical protein
MSWVERIRQVGHTMRAKERLEREEKIIKILCEKFLEVAKATVQKHRYTLLTRIWVKRAFCINRVTPFSLSFSCFIPTTARER